MDVNITGIRYCSKCQKGIPSEGVHEVNVSYGKGVLVLTYKCECGYIGSKVSKIVDKD